MTDEHSDFREFTLKRMAQSSLPGLCYAYVTGGKVEFSGGFGFSDLENRTGVTADTLFGLGSVTKLFTAVAVMQLYEQGLVQLEAPVEEYIDFPFRPEGKPVQVQHFLTHSSGIPALGYSESKLSPRWFMHGLPVNSVEELITFMQGCEEWVECEPGQSWHYLNEGYILLGAIIEAVSGKPYGEYVREHILEPVGMARTCFRRQAVEQQNDVATQYMLDRAGDFFEGSNLYGEIPAAGGLVSCLNDMASFATVLLNVGKTHEGTQLVQSDTLELMFEPRVDLPYAHHDAFEGGVLDDLTYSQGYGFQITKGFFGERLAAHGGGVMGGTSYLALFPAEGAAMVLLSNGHGYPLSQLALYGLARFGGLDASQLPFIKLEETLAQYRGRYESFRGTIMADVEQKGSCLELRLVFQNEDRVLTLVPTQLGRSRARFQTFSGGRRSEVVFSQVNGNSTHTEFVYERYKFRKTQVNGDWNEEAQK